MFYVSLSSRTLHGVKEIQSVERVVFIIFIKPDKSVGSVQAHNEEKFSFGFGIMGRRVGGRGAGVYVWANRKLRARRMGLQEWMLCASKTWNRKNNLNPSKPYFY